MKYKKSFITILCLCLTMQLYAQNKLQSGFDAKEYCDLLSLAYFHSSIPDSAERAIQQDPYKLIYRSQEVGFKNRWTLYLRSDNVACIDLRGTINHQASWLANIYAAMIPATGSLQINDSTRFDYKLSQDSNAAVHVGWMVGLAHLAPGIKNKIDSLYKKDVKEFLIFGHSQGGALAFLLRSYLEYEKQKGNVPADIIFKTYCSAAPKPGNLNYAYDFDFITRNGWAFTVVNSLDWVPESPFSVQTDKDFNPPSPIGVSSAILKNGHWTTRLTGDVLNNKINKKPRKAQKKFEKYLGHYLYKFSVSKILPQFKEPKYFHSNNYTRAGSPIVLMPDSAYHQKFSANKDALFPHHSFRQYYFLVEKYYSSK